MIKAGQWNHFKLTVIGSETQSEVRHPLEMSFVGPVADEQDVRLDPLGVGVRDRVGGRGEARLYGPGELARLRGRIETLEAEDDVSPAPAAPDLDLEEEKRQ